MPTIAFYLCGRYTHQDYIKPTAGLPFISDRHKLKGGGHNLLLAWVHLRQAQTAIHINLKSCQWQEKRTALENSCHYRKHNSNLIHLNSGSWITSGILTTPNISLWIIVQV